MINPSKKCSFKEEEKNEIVLDNGDIPSPSFPKIKSNKN